MPTVATFLPRNLVLCCDGTGNIWKPGPEKTNVAKLFAVLEKSPLQRAFYDPGVGTPDGTIADGGGIFSLDTWRRVGGLAWGHGVWQNVAEGYDFLRQNYCPGDRIYLFGFSRGAFTARAISGLVYMFGLLRAEHDNLLPAVLRVYRSHVSDERKKAAAEFRQQFAASFPGSGSEVPIHFIGCWDTVESVGMGQFLGAEITSDAEVKPTFRHVRHALALDELRWPFTPRLYQPPRELPADGSRSYQQVWFRGAHSDVGGGYKDAGLSNGAWHWLVREAYALGLRLEDDALQQYPVQPSALLHSQITQTPFWLLTGVFARKIPADAVLHDSVKARDAAGDSRPFAWPEQATFCATSSEFPGASGPQRVPLPVDQAAVPCRQKPAAWLSLLLPLSGMLAALLWLPLNDANGQALWHLQLGAGRVNFWQLGQSLAVSAAEVTRLLRLDFLFIVSYSLFCVLLFFHLFHAMSWRRYPAAWLGKTACFALVALPLADLAENLFTLGALDSRLAASPAWLFPPQWWEGVCSLLTTLAATAKFTALLALLLVGVSALACLRRPRH